MLAKVPGVAVVRGRHAGQADRRGAPHLFEEEADLVVGFSDTFDTATADILVISSSSLQGRLIQRIYHGDVTALDADLDDALASVEVVAVETRDAKRHGKLRRYPVGTVAVLEHDRRPTFAVAFSRTDDNLGGPAHEGVPGRLCFRHLRNKPRRFGQLASRRRPSSTATTRSTP
ncbi:macro domain-containing protein [Streptomyces olivochromogenes]|uniref:macro domain-containing protein n=1 Tax=Streptomyces olivochromogenes TaxID=1963 RepID=UPI0036974C37